MEEPFKEFIQWWDSPNTQYALREASDYTKAKAAFYAAWALREPEPGPMVPPELRELEQEQFRASVPPFEVPGQYPGPVPAPGQQSPGWRSAYPSPLSGPPPVTRIDQYAFQGASDVGVMPSQAHREQQRYVETQMMPVVDDTNPGFPVTEFTPTVWNGQEAANGQA